MPFEVGAALHHRAADDPSRNSPHGELDSTAGPQGMVARKFPLTWNSMLSHLGRFSRQHDGFLAAGWFRDGLACYGHIYSCSYVPF